ncbi:MAG: IclR family transcriptional regulator C-terminal domain-containing protein [Pseudomonadota bacterium]
MPIDQEDPDYVTALARGLAVIRAFGKGAENLTLSDVAEAAGVNRGATRRSLLTLESLGYVQQQDRHFRLSPRVMELGFSYLSSLPLWEHAQPVMKSIVDQIDESCSLAVLDGSDVVYLARVPPRHIYTIPVPVGARMPAYVNAMGRVLLAELDPVSLADYFQHTEIKKVNAHTVTDEGELRAILSEVRKSGFAMPEHEMHDGRRSIAVPIRNRAGHAVAALNISAMMSRASREDFLGKFLPLLRNAAATLTPSI